MSKKNNAKTNKRNKKAQHNAQTKATKPSNYARVIVNHGNRSVIRDINDDQLLTASARRGKRPVCGDMVDYQAAAEEQGDITNVHARSTELSRADFRGKRRVLAANLSQMIIVVAAKPATSLALVDRYLVAAEYHQLKAMIVINKADIEETTDAFLEDFSPYQSIGYSVIRTSNANLEGLEPLKKALNNEVSILLGQSGVGKSTLTQAMIDKSIQIRIGALSERAQLGQHTTTSTHWYDLYQSKETLKQPEPEQPEPEQPEPEQQEPEQQEPEQQELEQQELKQQEPDQARSNNINSPKDISAIIDSPGVRDFTLEFIPASDLDNCFIEFRPFLGQCRFNNCLHKHEPSCAILEAVSANKISTRRHQSYLYMLNNLTEIAQ